jgi:SNF2 family DNA or RNA helicase
MHCLLRQLPGPFWDSKKWRIPSDLAWLFEEPSKTVVPHKVRRQLNDKLYPYQITDVARCLQERDFLLVYEMGLGKTVVAIETMRLAGITRAIIVCPAIVRNVWSTEFDKWWPEHPSVTLIEKGKDPWPEDGIVVVSYDLATRKYNAWKRQKKDCVLWDEWQAVIFDEAHYLKDGRSQRSEMARTLWKKTRGAFHLGLTATPITNEPKDLWHVNRCLRGSTFGGWSAFTERHCLIDVNDYGYEEVFGLDPDHAEELEKRVSHFSARATKSDPDVAKYLPPLTVQAVMLEKPKLPSWREMLEKWSGERRLHDTELDAYFQKAGHLKVKPAIELAKEVSQAHSHVFIATYFHDTAHAIRDGLQDHGNVIEVTGKITPAKRKKYIDKAKGLDQCFFVASMKSVGEGIDLTFCTGTIQAEMSYVPADIIQLWGRVHRLNSGLHAHIWMLIVKGTLDEVIAERLMEKQTNISSLFRKGVTEEKLLQALTPSARDNEDVVKEALKAIAGMKKEDAYV